VSHAVIVGNATRDPELRYSPSGHAICSFSVAENRKVKDREVVSFYDIVCFGSLATNVAESVSKGTRVVVTGRLEQRSWESDSGEKRSKVEVVADEVGPSLRWAVVDVQRNERTDRPHEQGEPF
jgi:single-strand DNA-binding protein